MPIPSMRDSYVIQAWIKHAESDLRIAESAPAGVLLEHLCFHAQQAAEKSIKAVLASRDVVPPKTHDIKRLLILVAEHDGHVPAGVRQSARLSQYAVLSRYVADLGEIDESEWNEALDLARAALSWAKATVQDTL